LQNSLNSLLACVNFEVIKNELYIIMKKLALFFFIFSSTLLNYSQQYAYKIFNNKGKSVGFSKMVKSTVKADVVLFGEYHDNPISHWLQFELASELINQQKLIIGLEMLESDNQHFLNQYMDDKISYTDLDSLARLWSNYSTDYAPIIEMAKEKKCKVVCTNIPRKYARMVYRNGGFEALDNISENEKKFIAPFPILFDPELSQYKNMLEFMGGHGSPDIVKAQAIKDATMAHFISENLKDNHIFLHLNGAYHSDFFQGILWYLIQARPTLNYKTISTVNQQSIRKLEKEHLGRADFIICVDNNMTKTH
tara:strand:- start:3512 stop:4438 length:927 start_codon:yes stop_codon:yes gene_type:complete